MARRRGRLEMGQAPIAEQRLIFLYRYRHCTGCESCKADNPQWSWEQNVPLNATKIEGNQALPYSKSHFEVQRRPDRQMNLRWLCLISALVIGSR